MGELESTRTDEVYATVRRWILTLRIGPGAAFSESAIAAELGTSKTPVREALARLRRDGLVQVQSRSGYTALPITLKDARDVCQLRTLLEAESARLAVQVAETGESIEHAVREVDAIDVSSAVGFSDWLAADRQLHLDIARMGGNDRLVSALEQVVDQVGRLFYLARALSPAVAAELVHSHERLVLAINAMDVSLGREYAVHEGERAQALLLKTIATSSGIRDANAMSGATKNTFYLDTD